MIIAIIISFLVSVYFITLILLLKREGRAQKYLYALYFLLFIIIDKVGIEFIVHNSFNMFLLEQENPLNIDSSSALYILLSVITGIILVAFDINLIIAKIFLCVRNPFSKDPWNFSSFPKEILIIGLKHILSIVQALDPDFSYAVYELLIISIFYLAILYFVFSSPVNPQISALYIEILLIVNNCCMVIFALLSYFLDDNSESLTTFLIISLIVGLAFIIRRNNNYENSASKAFSFNTLKIDFNEACDVVTGLIKRIEGFDFPSSRIEIISMLKKHQKNCNRINCECNQIDDILNHKIVESNVNKESKKPTEEFQESRLSKDSPLNHNSINSRNINLDKRTQKERIKTVSYGLLYFQLSSFVLMDSSAEFHILFNHVQFHLIHLRHKCLFEIHNIRGNRPSIFDKFEVYCLKNEITHSLIVDEGKFLRSDKSSKSNEFTKYIIYHKYNLSLTKSMYTMSNNYKNLWDLFGSYTNNYKDLMKILCKMSNNFEKIEFIFKKIQEVNNTSIKAACNMCLFFYYVIDDPFSASDLCQQVRKLQESFNISSKFNNEIEKKIGENSQVSVVQISGQKDILGTILNVNNEISQLLGFKREEILFQNVGILMPNIIKENHNLYLQEYIKNENNEINDRKNDSNLYVLAQHSHGYLIPCNILTKIIIDKESRLRFIGFITEQKISSKYRNSIEEISLNEAILILIDSNGLIIGLNACAASLITSNPLSSINLNKYLQSEEKVHIYEAIPELREDNSKADLESTLGLNKSLNIKRFIGILKRQIIDYNYSNEGKAGKEIKSENENLVNAYSNSMLNCQFKTLSSRGTCVLCSIYPTNLMASEAKINAYKDNEVLIIGEKDEINKMIVDGYESASVSSTSSSDSRYGRKVIREYKLKTATKKSSLSIKLSRIFAILGFLIIFSFYTVDYIQVYNSIESYQNDLSNNHLIYELTTQISQAEICIQTIYDLILETDTISKSEIKNFENRILANLIFVQNYSEQIRKSAYALNSLSNFDTIFTFMNVDLHLRSLQEDLNGIYYTETTMFGFLNLIVNSLISTSQITDALQNTTNITKINTTLQNHFKRDFFFILNNSLEYYFLKAYDRTDMIADELLKKFNSTIILIEAISASFCALIAILFFLYYCYISRIYTQCNEIAEIFLTYDKEKADKILNKIEMFSNNINSSFIEIKKLFNSTNFNFDEMVEEEIKKKNKEDKENEGIQIKIKTEDKNKTKKMILNEYFFKYKLYFAIKITFLCCVILAFSIYKIFYFKTQSENSLQGIDTSNCLLQLIPSLSEIIVFEKYTVANGFFPQVDYNSSLFNLYEFILKMAEDNSEKLRLSMALIEGFYPLFDIAYDEVIHQTFCHSMSEFIKNYSECEAEGGTLFASGLTNVKTTFFGIYSNAFNELENLLKKKKEQKEIQNHMAQIKELQTYPELKIKYMDDLYNYLSDYLVENLLNQMQVIQTYYLVFYPVSAIVVLIMLIIYVQILISTINNHVIYIRRLLGLVPSEYIRINRDLCTQHLKNVS